MPRKQDGISHQQAAEIAQLADRSTALKDAYVEITRLRDTVRRRDEEIAVIEGQLQQAEAERDAARSELAEMKQRQPGVNYTGCVYCGTMDFRNHEPSCVLLKMRPTDAR